MSILGYEEHLGTPLISDDDTDHGNHNRALVATIGKVVSPSNVYFVSPQFTEGNLNCGEASDRRHFATIGEAIFVAPAGSTILVYPGTYNEPLGIGKSLRIIGVGGGFGFGGGLPIVQYNAAAPVVAITPQAGETLSLTLANLQIKQNWTGSGSQSWPFWIDINDQGVGNFGPYRNRIDLHNCIFRQDTVPAVFGQGILCQGWAALGLNQCQFKVGAATDHYIGSLIYLFGNTTAAKQAWLYARDCAFEHPDYAGTYTFRFDYLASGMYSRNSSTRSRATSVVFGIYGTNSCGGLNNDSQFDAMRNIAGYALLDITA